MKKTLNSISKNLEHVVSLDLRALGIFRILMGIILVIDFLDRLKDAKLFYSNDGIPSLMNFPTSILTTSSFSINNLNGSTEFQILVIFIALIIALLFLAGYKTRLMTILAWIFVVSIQNRNFIILQGGDDYIRLLLFWSIFLPLGAKFSVDSLMTDIKYKTNQYISPANIGYIFQIFFLYFFAALLKNNPIWNVDFTAIYYSLRIDIFVTPIGKFMYQFRELLQPLTMFVYYLELFVGFIILFPFYNYIFRTIAVILIIGLHIGIGTTLDIGHFPWVAIVAAIGLMPTETMDLLVRWLEKLLKKARLDFSFISSFFKKRFEFDHSKAKIKKPNHKLNNFVNLAVAVIIFTITIFSYAWNTNNLRNTIPLSSEIRNVMLFFRLDQNWGMFAPFPFMDDGWYVLIGEDTNGKVISLFGKNQKTSIDKKPENYYNEFPNERWRKFMTNLWYVSYHSYRERLLEFQCSEWNIENEIKLKKIDMYYMLEKTPPPGAEDYKIEKLLLASKDCIL
jgi:hypothetical protein